MNYEKAYKEALERANIIYTGKYKPEIAAWTKKSLEAIFHELAELEDERIRKVLIDYFNNANKSDENPLYEYGIYTDKVINWLEKQGEQKDINPTLLEKEKMDNAFTKMMFKGKTALEAIKEEKIDNANKIEPKFQNGQWIVWQNKCYKVKYNDCGYELIDQNGLSTSLEYGTIDENAHLWTIQDAKSGDVLVASDGSLFIFAKVKDNSAYFHFSLCKDGSKEISNGNLAWETANNCHPATKEQRDHLFQKMQEASYEWDEKKKELRKIEKQAQKPKWTEEDKTIMEDIIGYFQSERDITSDEEYIMDLDKYLRLLQRVRKAMKELIDKSAVIAEIERLSAYYDSLYEQRIIEKILFIIDTLEVKEVDLDFPRFAKEMEIVFALPSSKTKNTEENPLNWEYAIAKHFFELGMKTKGE